MSTANKLLWFGAAGKPNGIQNFNALLLNIAKLNEISRYIQFTLTVLSNSERAFQDLASLAEFPVEYGLDLVAAK